MNNYSCGHCDKNHPLKVPPKEMSEQKYPSEQQNGEFGLVKSAYGYCKDDCAYEGGLSVKRSNKFIKCNIYFFFNIFFHFLISFVF